MADVLAIRESYRAQSWGMLIRECQASGLSNREFCKQRGVSEKSYYYWLRKLRQQAVEDMPELVPLDPVPENYIQRGKAFCSGERRYGCSSSTAEIPSEPMIDLSKVSRYYIACGYTDLRLGIDGLAAVVTQQYGGHVDEESLFLFCGRRTDRIKALYWSGDGYILLYKRLSNGRFQWPRSEAELRQLDPQSFRWLMEGLKVEQRTAIRKGKPKDLF